jgi:hypothetical protein
VLAESGSLKVDDIFFFGNIGFELRASCLRGKSLPLEPYVFILCSTGFLKSQNFNSRMLLAF